MAAMLNTVATLPLKSIASTCKSPHPLFFPTTSGTTFTDNHCSSDSISSRLSTYTRRRDCIVCSGVKKSNNEEITSTDDVEVYESEELDLKNETMLYSINPMSLMLLAALPGAETVRSAFAPFVEIVKSLNLPDWLVHWGHPGNMAVVLFAMGGYGTYLGFRIRFSDDVEEKAKAKDLHPKLLAGMFFFFALGATGGVTSLLTSDRPIFESPHAVTGVIGLALLTLQTILPTLFEGNPGLRNVHGILGSGIMTFFVVHAALGLQLGLSY
ncbi:uncharacterized protein LOC110709920 [Chenopodium quinoa]|uniref:uncharacterized protein LOC110709920 n=1 Tax=Chenopodium quinoa TaxID=63459 RepID=UPI000B771F23|nr:uncharacterized protein LOC110709920 [Chenopodium quinoa]